jgi:hypothetical protein
VARCPLPLPPSQTSPRCSLQEPDQRDPTYRDRRARPLPFQWLNENSISGLLPTQLGELTALTRLYLYANRLSGLVPSELGLATGLGKTPDASYCFLANSQTGFVRRPDSNHFACPLPSLTTNPCVSRYGFVGAPPSLPCHDPRGTEDSIADSLPTQLGRISTLSRLHHSNRLQ